VQQDSHLGDHLRDQLVNQLGDYFIRDQLVNQLGDYFVDHLEDLLEDHLGDHNILHVCYSIQTHMQNPTTAYHKHFELLDIICPICPICPDS
jgi:hypothetical protein